MFDSQKGTPRLATKKAPAKAPMKAPAKGGSSKPAPKKK